MHDVIAAIATAPWSSSNSVAVASVTGDRVARASAVRSARLRAAAARRCRPRGRRTGRRRRGSDSATASSYALLAASSSLVDVVGQRAAEGLLGVGQRDAVLRALRPGQRRDDRRQVELEVLGEARLGVGVVPEPLLLGVGLDQRDLLVGAAGELEVLGGLLVDREDRDRGAELRAHVADRGPVGQRQRRDAGAVELDELADDAVLAQHLGDRQHQVGGGRALGQVAVELEADDARDQHRHGLAEHRRLGLDAADAPADDADAVDHRGVRVGADAGVGVGRQLAVDLAGEHHAGEVLDVDLVHDAGAGRDDLEVVEGALAPAQELVALAVALVLDLDVALERLRACRRRRRSRSGR